MLSISESGPSERYQSNVSKLVEIEARLHFSGFHARHIFKPVAQPKRPVVMKIVAQKHIGGRSLFARGFQRRMRLHQRHRGEPAAVGDAQQSRAAVVVRARSSAASRWCRRYRCLRRSNCGFVAIAHRPLHHELAFGLIAPANILKNENESFVGELFVAALRAPLRRGRCRSRKASARSENGSFAAAFFGAKISVCSFTPSRAGIMTSVLSHWSAAWRLSSHSTASTDTAQPMAATFHGVVKRIRDRTD